jgi:arylsulfatase A-like enzyme
MIVRWPGNVQAQKTSDAPWYFADLLPTLAELAAVKPPTGIDGISVLPTLLGKKQNTADRFFYWEFPSGGFKQAVRWRNYKAVRLAPDRPLELYDLEKDESEINNIADRHPAIIKKITTYLKTARTDSPYWPIKTPKNNT